MAHVTVCKVRNVRQTKFSSLISTLAKFTWNRKMYRNMISMLKYAYIRPHEREKICVLVCIFYTSPSFSSYSSHMSECSVSYPVYLSIQCDVRVQFSHQHFGGRPGDLSVFGFPFLAIFASWLSSRLQNLSILVHWFWFISCHLESRRCCEFHSTEYIYTYSPSSHRTMSCILSNVPATSTSAPTFWRRLGMFSIFSDFC